MKLRETVFSDPRGEILRMFLLETIQKRKNFSREKMFNTERDKGAKTVHFGRCLMSHMPLTTARPA
jgi:hypothetical protein